MSTKLKSRKAQDLLNTQNSIGNGNGNNNNFSNENMGSPENNDDNGSYKHINYPIDNTPFRVMGNERDGFILVLGKHRLNAVPASTPKDCEELLEKDTWNIIFEMVATMLEINDELRKTTLDNSNSL